VSNLISTDPRLLTRFTLDDYTDKSKTAHYFDDFVIKDLKKTLKQKRCHPYHFFSYPGQKFASLMKEKSYIVINNPSTGSIGYNRMKKLFPKIDCELFWHELSCLYTAENFKKVYEIKDPCIDISGDAIFEDLNFVEYLADKTHKLGLTINKEICHKAHHLWLNKI